MNIWCCVIVYYLLVFTCFICILKVNNSCDTVLQVCNTQCKIHVSSVDLIHFCSVLSLMLFCAYYLDCLLANYYCDGHETVMQSVYVINCIEVIVITTIVGESWRFNWN